WPQPAQPVTQPKAFVASADERVRVHAQNSGPDLGPASERTVPADLAGQFSVEVKPESQNQVNNEARRDRRFQKARVAPGPITASRQDHQTADHQANAGGGAIRQIQQPKSHAYKRKVNGQD